MVDALWPHLAGPAGAANLRKAAHHARRALGDPRAVTLRSGQVELWPGRALETDVDCFERAADEALRGDDPAACAKAAALCTGELLPDALYEDWTRDRREHLQARHRALLRGAGDWERLLEVDPTDEAACRALMRGALDRGNRAAAIRWYGRLRAVLEKDLGVRPGPATDALYAECVAGLHPAGPELVGRQVELARVAAALRAAGRGEAGLLVVRGAAGLGKSALCRAVAAAARDEGRMVTLVTATSGGGAYAPVVDAVEQRLDRDRGLLDRLPVRTRSVLAELTPLAAPAPPLDGPLTRHQVIGALRRVLRGGGDTGGGDTGVLVVDDAHLADDATLDALLHLAAGRTAGLLVVLAHRPGHDVLARGVARLDRAGAVVAVDLAPLEPGDAAALVAAAAPGTPPGRDVDAVVDLADGNPFFLVELARTAGARQGIGPGDRAAVVARFVDLDPDTAAVLARVALAGDDLDPAEAVAVTGLPDDAAAAVLDAALDGEVLVVAGTRYRFRHELVRRARADRFPPHRRAAVHRDVAERLAG
ncbi:MAG: AAA family ATPase, partial [Pseudonocardiales bacterium]|nr:AAA family ATPase [Pseudonocardiales bacterium]